MAGDALVLPFRDGVFDAVTISFGLRNVADPPAALAEMRRVTRPGGRLLICEFSHLASPGSTRLYGRFLSAWLPMLARRLSANPEAYSYLAESIGQLAGRAGAGRHDQRRGLDRRPLAGPVLRHGRAAPGEESGGR